jgi:predicted amidohydrolase
MEPRLGRVDANVDRAAKAIVEAKAGLVVFPECALTGYGFESKTDALVNAVELPSSATDRLAEACRKAKSLAVVGLLEKSGKRLFNSAVLIGPKGILGLYRKMHLPFLGADRFATPGDRGFPVFETPAGKIGILICYDGSFPEAPRSLKLAGAQLICLPTNFPEAAEVSCVHAPMVRAHENHVHFVSCNRVGTEGGFTFRGESKICDFEGRVLAQAGRQEQVISAELDPAAADANRVVYVPGRYELDRIAHRRPEAYVGLVNKVK